MDNCAKKIEENLDKLKQYLENQTDMTDPDRIAVTLIARDDDRPLELIVHLSKGDLSLMKTL